VAAMNFMQMYQYHNSGQTNARKSKKDGKQSYRYCQALKVLMIEDRQLFCFF
jgi:hypothetical protein